MKIALLFLIFVSVFYFSAFAQSHAEIVVVSGKCSYEFKLKDTENSPEKFSNQFLGRGFLVGHKNHSLSDNSEYVVTAGHVISCKPDLERAFWGYDVISFSSSEVFVEYKGTKYGAIILKEGFEARSLDKEDKGLVAFVMPKNLKHKHFSLTSKNFKYSVGDNVYTPGFLYFGDQRIKESQRWKRVFQQGRIVDIDEFYIYVGFAAYPGMSGSPLMIEKSNKLFFWRKKNYVIGIISRSSLAPSGERVPHSMATRVNKEF